MISSTGEFLTLFSNNLCIEATEYLLDWKESSEVKKKTTWVNWVLFLSAISSVPCLYSFPDTWKISLSSFIFFFSCQQIPFLVSSSSVGHDSRPFPLDFTVHELLVASTNWWGHSRLLPGHWKCDVGLCSQRKKCHHKPASERWHVGFILCIIRSRDKEDILEVNR